MGSGYTHCACRDCFETVVSGDMSQPEFCEECEEAGCDCDADSEGSHDHECRREDAYGDSDDFEDFEDDGYGYNHVRGHARDREDFHSDG